MDTKDLEKRTNKSGSISYWKDGVLVGKKCTVCGEDKPISEFNFYNKKKGLRRAYCNKCHAKQTRRWYKNNDEKAKEISKRWCKNNYEYVKEKRKEYYQSNIEKYRERNRKWREENIELAKEYSKRYQKENRDKLLEYKKEYYITNKEYLLGLGKEYRVKQKESNIKETTSLLEQINPLIKELNLNIYGSIYKITHKNGHCYIGQTIQPLKGRYHGNIIKGWIKEKQECENQKFLNELNEDDLKIEIIDVGICKWHLDKLEAYYIAKYDSCNNGYNNYAGNHKTDNGVGDFLRILEENELEFVDNKIIKKRLHE